MAEGQTHQAQKIAAVLQELVEPRDPRIRHPLLHVRRHVRVLHHHQPQLVVLEHQPPGVFLHLGGKPHPHLGKKLQGWGEQPAFRQSQGQHAASSTSRSRESVLPTAGMRASSQTTAYSPPEASKLLVPLPQREKTTPL